MPNIRAMTYGELRLTLPMLPPIWTVSVAVAPNASERNDSPQ